MQDQENKQNEDLKKQLEEWKCEQLAIASQVIVKDEELAYESIEGRDRFAVLKSVSEKKFYGGVDVSFPENESHQSVATYVIVDPISDTIVYKDYLYFDLKIPYFSSFLSFREIEPLEYLVKKQMRESPSFTPSVIIVDGNGILHRRRAGIACFLGVKTGLPTVGIGKTLYCEGGLQKDIVQQGIDNVLFEINNAPYNFRENKEKYVVIPTAPICPNEVSPIKYDVDRAAILKDLNELCCGVGIMLKVDSCELIGAALLGHGGKIGRKRRDECRTKNPIYVSVGHKMSLPKAVLLCAELSKTRIPEPVRQADLWGRELLRNKKRELHMK